MGGACAFFRFFESNEKLLIYYHSFAKSGRVFYDRIRLWKARMSPV